MLGSDCHLQYARARLGCTCKVARLQENANICPPCDHSAGLIVLSLYHCKSTLRDTLKDLNPSKSIVEMSEDDQSNPKICNKEGCNFYGSKQYGGFCSNCARKEDVVIKKNNPRSEGSTADSIPNIPSTLSLTAISKRPSMAGRKRKSESLETDDTDSDIVELEALSLSAVHQSTSCEAKLEGHHPDNQCPDSDKTGSGTTKKRKINRCHVCSKKVGLLGFDCRCGGLFCGLHRGDQDHACTFDYKPLQRAELAKNNPKIVADKVTKI